MCYNVCIFCTIKSLTLLFSTPITIISADTLCNFCSLLSLFQRSAPFLPLANPGGLQGIYAKCMECANTQNHEKNNTKIIMEGAQFKFDQSYPACLPSLPE